jgi:hypothetical protein
MTEITPKEKILVSILVRLYSKEQLEEELKNLLDSFDGNSKLVRGAGKLIGIDSYLVSRLGMQYVNYAIENYEKIQNKEFPEKIDRVKTAYFYGEEVEDVRTYSMKRAKVNVLSKYFEDIEERVYNNFYEFDPDTINQEYGDGDFISFKPDKDSNEIVDTKDNVIN